MTVLLVILAGIIGLVFGFRTGVHYTSRYVQHYANDLCEGLDERFDTKE